jgi:hypothetical protein
MPMKNFTQSYSSKNDSHLEASPEKECLPHPRKQSIEMILAYSKSLEVKRSNYVSDMLLTLN